MNGELIRLYREISDLTRPKCHECEVPHYCCAPEHCEATIRYAAELGVFLSATDHPQLPLLGPDGVCTVAPHLRPICSVHVCENHLWEPEFAERYYALRDAINEEEVKAHPEIYGDYEE